MPNPPRSKVTWHGNRIKKAMVRAAKAAINQGLAEAVEDAKQSRAWQDRTGELRRSIEVLQPALNRGGSVGGYMGSKLWYSSIVEAKQGRPMKKARDKAGEKMGENLRREFQKRV